MATTRPRRKTQQRKQPVLFQNKTLNTIFGPTRRTMTTRIIMVVITLGILTVFTIGLIHPNQNTSPIAGTPQAAASPSVGTQVGNLAPNITFTTLDGKQVSLLDYRGKPVILDFWNIGCRNCRRELPQLQHFYAAQQAAGKDLVVLGVDVVDGPQTLAAFLQTFKLTYQVVLDQNNLSVQLYQLSITPTSFFIDRQGIIRAISTQPLVVNVLQANTALIS